MGSIPSERYFKAQSVCVIGAGPSGIAAAKYLLAEKAFSKIVVYEQRSRTGGLWNYTPLDIDSSSTHVPVPQTSPDHVNSDAKQGGDVLTPVYERLETNIPRNLMGFSDLDWPSERQLFPKHENVLDYIEDYAQDVKHLIQFNTKILNVKLTPDEKWTVESESLSSDAKKIEVFDAVICANGHYDVPYIPDVSGIREWNEAYPNVISHSKFYRKPENYAGKKVIVVGNSASGIDIGAQIETVCQKPLIISSKSESYLNVEGAKATHIEKPPIEEYLIEDRSVRFTDGTIEKDIDAIVYCTGYFYSYPFLDSLSPPLITSGERVENTYQHIFYQPQPTLSFLVLNQKVIPFPMAEVQSAVIARVLSGRLSLPSEDETAAWEQETIKEMGSGRNFHVLKFPRDAEQINMLSDWARSAAWEGEGIGKTPPRWEEEQYWIRERFPSIKKAFADVGEERCEVRSLSEIGYDYGKWKEEKREGEHTL